MINEDSLKTNRNDVYHVRDNNKLHKKRRKGEGAIKSQGALLKWNDTSNTTKYAYARRQPYTYIKRVVISTSSFSIL